MIFSAAALLMPTVLSAQYTTFIAPPRKAVDSAKATVAVAKARADSIARMSLSEMKAWVDSAAGVSSAKIAAASTDTTMVSAVATVPDERAAPSRTTTTFSNGAIAPNTASPLPEYLVTGLGAFAAGMLLLGLRQRRAKIRRR
jgi:hypothetical protein